ncbi:hypothetical protein PTSG_10482 [Salpingoeca rosetta]|uniref:TNFR-Cys domain-containing protein n=1 Tax=Salpingoeca rosetta (strain ATCC 50818 / BSB-021) TaxID=946362 RepID=F2UPS9_SALR5|nr:uncharacterized protein PTSG_10482 [Salpingoeca rosetta]EGD79634.1 hypothetical protein PTSG_10482 [Salpingoeca rosetta]|eukprot:XP_004988862.1 hypothetical protein PTSG_10482 [Salpingoeca rosetta]
MRGRVQQPLLLLLLQIAVIAVAAAACCVPGVQALGTKGPSPAVAFMFNTGSDTDAITGLGGTYSGQAQLGHGGIHFTASGEDYFTSDVLPFDMPAEKTLEVWVRLDDLNQRAGGALSVQSADGSRYDGIVYAELAPFIWETGSEWGERSLDAGEVPSPPERAAAGAHVHIVATYSADGYITIYRNGRVYVPRYRKAPAAAFDKSDARITLGARHVQFGQQVWGQLKGHVECARVYTSTLTQEQIQQSFSTRCHRVNPFDFVEAGTFEGLAPTNVTSTPAVTPWSKVSPFGKWSALWTDGSAGLPALVVNTPAQFAQGVTAAALHVPCSSPGFSGIKQTIATEPGHRYSLSFIAAVDAADMSTSIQSAFQQYAIVTAGSMRQVFRPTYSAVGGRASWSRFRFTFDATDTTTHVAFHAEQANCIMVDNVRVVQVFDGDNLVLDGGFEEAAVELGVPYESLDATDASSDATPGQALAHWTVSPSSGSKPAVLRPSIPFGTSSWALSLHGQACTASQFAEVFQVIPTMPGATYAVSFGIMNRRVVDNMSANTSTASISVSFGSLSQAQFFTRRGQAHGHFTTRATATTHATTLRLAAPASSCVLVDYVHIRPLTAAPVNMVSGGDFEVPALPIGDDGTTRQQQQETTSPLPPDSQWSSDRGVITGPTSSGGGAAVGAQNYRLQQLCTTAGTIKQVLPTVAGVHYQLSFFARANAAAQLDVVSGTVAFASLVDTFTLESPRLSASAYSDWVPFSFTVVADEDSESIVFHAQAQHCIELDGISVFPIAPRNLSVPDAAGYPVYVSTASAVTFAELEDACAALNAVPAVITNDADFEAAADACASFCYVAYTRASANNEWMWAGDDDNTYTNWAYGDNTQFDVDDLVAAVAAGRSGLVPAGDGDNAIAGLCTRYTDFRAWAGVWSVVFGSRALTTDIAIDGSARVCAITSGSGGTQDQTCTNAAISLVRVDGFNDYYRIEQTGGTAAEAEERIELSADGTTLTYHTLNTTTGRFVEHGVGTRVLTCPGTIDNLDPNAVASCPLNVQPSAPTAACRAMCKNGFIASTNTSTRFTCTSKQGSSMEEVAFWSGNLECVSTFEEVQNVTIPFATSAATDIDNLVDGDTASFWQSRSNAFESSLFFDLSAPTTVRRIRIYTMLQAGEDSATNAIPRTIRVDAASNIRYPFDTHVATLELDPITGWQAFDVATKTQFIRLKLTDTRNDAFVRVHEVKFDRARDGRAADPVIPPRNPDIPQISFCSSSSERNASLAVRDGVTAGLVLHLTFDDDTCPYVDRVSAQRARTLGPVDRTAASKIGTHAAVLDGQSSLVLNRPDVYVTAHAIALWIRLAAPPTSTPQFIAGDWPLSGDADTLQFANLFLRENELRETSTLNQAASVSWEAGRWYHIVSQRGPYDKSLFVDGERVAFDQTGVDVPGLRDAFWIGSRGAVFKGTRANDRFFTGSVDDVRLYDRTLAPSEIKRIFNAGYCSPGSYFDPAKGCQGHTECKPGTVETTPPTATSDRVCAPCPAGSLPGNNTCVPCTAGAYVPAGRTGACADFACKPGTVDADADPATACEPCDGRAEHQPLPGQMSCTPHRTCDVGQEPDATRPANAIDDTTCKPCSVGTFKNVTGNSECVLASFCPPGTSVQAQPTASSDRTCAKCQPYTYSDTANAERCDEVSTCTPGTHETTTPTFTSDRECTPCEGGTFSNDQTAFECKACPTTCPGGHVLQSPCLSTEVGRGQSSFCTRCPQGTYRGADDEPTMCFEVTRCGQWQFEAKAATFSSDAVCTNCTTCSPGQYVFSQCGGQTDTQCRGCTCPDGFYLAEDCDPTSTRPPACRSCDPSCATCSQAGSCDTCAGALVKQPDGTCSDDCNTDEFRPSPTADCTACHSSCASCFGADDSQCLTCDAGKYLSEGSCVASCGNGARPVNGVCVPCDECKDGFFLQQCTSNPDDDCARVTTCAAGTEFTAAPATATKDTTCTTCKTCDPGTYRVVGTCEGSTDSICLQCDGITSYQDEPNQPRCKPMTSCPPGTHAERGTPSTDNTCTECTAGTTDHDYNPLTACVPCTPGTYVPANSTGPCSLLVCPAGTADDDRDPSTPCVACGDIGMNMYQPSTGQTTCLQADPCKPGTRELIASTHTSAPTCVQCTVGYDYQDKAGQTSCKPVTRCSDGEYEETAPTATSDRVCKNGNPCNLNSQYLLRPGTPTSEPVCAQLTVCTPPIEFEAAPPTPTSNRRCDRVSFCSEGTYEQRPPTATTDRVCQPLPSCPPGEGVVSNTNPTCTPCEPGTFSADRSATLCQLCPPNTFAADPAQAHCRDSTICLANQIETRPASPTADRMCAYNVDLVLVAADNSIFTGGDDVDTNAVKSAVVSVVSRSGNARGVDAEAFDTTIVPALTVRFLTQSESNAHQLRLWADSGALGVVYTDVYYTLRVNGSGDPFQPTTTPAPTTTGAVVCGPGREPQADGTCVSCDPGFYNSELSSSGCLPCPTNTFASSPATVVCEKTSTCSRSEFELRPPTPTSDRVCEFGIGTIAYLLPALKEFHPGLRDLAVFESAVRSGVVEPNAAKKRYPPASIKIGISEFEDGHVVVSFDSLSASNLASLSTAFYRGFVDMKLRGHNIRLALIGFNVTEPTQPSTTSAATTAPQGTTRGASSSNSTGGLNSTTLGVLIAVIVIVILCVVVVSVMFFRRGRTETATVNPYHSSFVNPIYDTAPNAPATDFFDPGEMMDDPATYTDIPNIEGRDASYMDVEA